MIYKNQALYAFSLVELSIVLVILGLLTGGILTGQSLIRAAEIRAVKSQLEYYSSSATIFKDKYFALPGDMPNATDFWNIASGSTGNDSACYSVESTTSATCNGNGDGYLDPPETITDYWREWESFTFWKHLANAGMVEGSYTGRTDSTSISNIYTAGKNVPASKISNASVRTMGDDDNIPDASDDQAMFYPIGRQAGNWFTVRSATGTVFAPEDMWSIDKKYDDGRPFTGGIITHKNTSVLAPDCATTDDITTGAYNLSRTDKICILVYYWSR